MQPSRRPDLQLEVPYNAPKGGEKKMLMSINGEKKKLFRREKRGRRGVEHLGISNRKGGSPAACKNGEANSIRRKGGREKNLHLLLNNRDLFREKRGKEKYESIRSQKGGKDLKSPFSRGSYNIRAIFYLREKGKEEGDDFNIS